MRSRPEEPHLYKQQPLCETPALYVQRYFDFDRPPKDMPTYSYMKMPQESLPTWVQDLPLLNQTPAVQAVVAARSCYNSVTSNHILDDFTENVVFYPFPDDSYLLFAASKAKLKSISSCR